MTNQTIEFDSGHKYVDNGVGDYMLVCPTTTEYCGFVPYMLARVTQPSDLCRHCLQPFGERTPTPRHSPLPWTIDGRDIIAANAEPVARIGDDLAYDDASEELAAADATLIMHAVNSHAELVAALRALMASYGGQRTGQGGGYSTSEERVMLDARAALIKAGESPKIGRAAFARAFVNPREDEL